MKKLITILGAVGLLSSTGVTVVSCTYLDTVQSSIENKIAQIINSTSHYFKGTILADVHKKENSQGELTNVFDAERIDSQIAKMTMKDLTSDQTDLTSMTKLFNSFLDSKSSEWRKTNIYENTEEWDVKKEKTQIETTGETINLIKTLFDQIYQLLGTNITPGLLEQAFGLGGESLAGMFDEDLNNQMIELAATGDMISNYAPSTFEELQELGVKTVQDLKNFAFSSLNMWLAKSFSIDIEKVPAVDFTDDVDNNTQMSDQTQAVWKEVASSLFNKDENSKTFKWDNSPETIKMLVDFVINLSQYISSFDNFESQGFRDAGTFDEDHLFDSELTNFEYIEKHTAKDLTADMINVDIQGIIRILKSILTGNSTGDSNYLKVFKILFQVDNNTNPDYSEVGNLKIKISGVNGGSWVKNSNNYQNGVVPYLREVIFSMIGSLLNSISDDPLLGFLIDILLNNKNKMNLSSFLTNTLSSILSNNNLKQFMSDFFDAKILDVIFVGKYTLAEALIEFAGMDKEMVNNLLSKIPPLMNKPISAIYEGEEFFSLIEGLIPGLELPEDVKNLSDLLNMKIGGIVSIADIANVLLTFIGDLPETALKVGNILSVIGETVDENTITITNSLDTKVDLRNFMGYTGTGEEKGITKIALGLKLTDSTYSGYTLKDTNGNKSFKGAAAGFYLLGIEKGKWVPGGIGEALSTLYDGQSGDLIKGLFKIIKTVIDTIVAAWPKSSDEESIEYLNYRNWETKLLAFDNLANSDEPSSIKYQIKYFDENSNPHSYEVSLRLDAALYNSTKAGELKYIIEDFTRTN